MDSGEFHHAEVDFVGPGPGLICSSCTLGQGSFSTISATYFIFLNRGYFQHSGFSFKFLQLRL